MLFKVLGLILVVTVPAVAATPETLQLAHRLIEDQLGSSDYVAGCSEVALAGFDRMAGWGHIPDVAGRKAALKEALTESASDIRRSEDELADVYATTLTRDELTAWTAFLETPEGRSIEAKKRQAGWPLGQPSLTPDEIAARKAFEDSAIGQSIISKNPQLLGKSIQISAALNARIGALANTIYCKTATCPAKDDDQ